MTHNEPSRDDALADYGDGGIRSLTPAVDRAAGMSLGSFQNGLTPQAYEVQ